MLRAGHGLMLLTAGLLSIGVIMVNSAGLTVGAAEPVSLTGIRLGRTTLLAVLAMAMMLIASRLPVDRLYRTASSAGLVPWIVIGVVLLLLAVHLPGVGRERLMQDMDTWGYSFRTGATRNWFLGDADDAKAWLVGAGVLSATGKPLFRLRGP